MAKLYETHVSVRGMARLLGYDHTTATVLWKIGKWAKVAKKKELGVTKTEDEWCIDLELTPKQFRRSKTKLKELGLIETRRGAWGKRPNAVFFKPSYLGERILSTPVYWTTPRRQLQSKKPSISPIGQDDKDIDGPSGQIVEALNCPNGILPYTNKTTNKEKLYTTAHLDRWSDFKTEDLYKLTGKTNVTTIKPYEIESIIEIIDVWDDLYSTYFDDNAVPVWTPRHISLVEILVEQCLETTMIVLERSRQSYKEEFYEEDDEVDDEHEYTLEYQGPICFKQTCQTIGSAFYWCLMCWGEFTELLENADVVDIPPRPEIDFLFFYLDIAIEFRSMSEKYFCDEDYFVGESLHWRKDRLKISEEKFWVQAKIKYPEVTITPWTFNDLKLFSNNPAYGFFFPFAALQLWDLWQQTTNAGGPPRPYSYAATIENFKELESWIFDYEYIQGHDCLTYGNSK